MSIYLATAILHVIGTALGVGGATMSDFMFLRSVKDGKLDIKEYGFLKMASRIVWTGLAILIVTGLGFVFVYDIVTEKVLAKGTVVAIILINGVVMHRKVFPLLKESAQKGAHLNSPPFAKKLPMTLAIGAISITSWYSALIIGAWRGLDASYEIIFGTYLGIVLIAITIAQFAGKYFVKRLPK